MTRAALLADPIRPSLGLALPLCIVATALVSTVRLTALWNEGTVLLAFSLPLLLGLFHRRFWLHYTMAAALTLTAVIAIAVQSQAPEPWGLEILRFVMTMLNIWVTTLVVHIVLGQRRRLAAHAALLEEANAELEARNEELAAHEEEIARQNEELQSQAEELEQQTEELSQQTEELTQQSDELTHANADLARREQALQTLLAGTRWLSGRGFADVASDICHAAVQALAEPAAAACIFERQDDMLVVRGHYGFGSLGPVKTSWRFDRSFGSIIMSTGRTAYLRDVTLRPDLEFAHPTSGQILRSLIAAPVTVRGQIRGVIKVYSLTPYDWTDEQFRIMDWFASQAALLIELMELQQENEARRGEAEAASVRKTRFLAAVSHDIRTPVNAITLLAELIERHAADQPEQSELYHLTRELRHNARSLVELVSDVLDIAHFDSGKLDLQLTQFPLHEALRREVRQLEPLARAKGIALELVASHQIQLHADRLKLGRALSNLIGNAIKFTDSGSVSVIAQRTDDGGVTIDVRDTGVGISPEHLARIFDEFTQLRNPERDRSKGAGLGLAICRRLLEALGGSLRVTSTVGVGSTFTISLPARRIVSTDNPASTAPTDQPCDSIAGLRILLVEDHDTTRRALRRLLAAEGASVCEAANGAAALDALAAETPDVLLLDLMLPDMDGRDVLKCLTAERPPRLRCVLVVSGDVTPERFADVRSLGADGMISKPIELGALTRAVTDRLKAYATDGAR